MPVYFTDKPPGLQYQPMKVSSGKDYEEYVEVYHVLPGTRQVVPSGQLCRIHQGEGSPSIRRLGTMAYLALLPSRPPYPCTVMECATKAVTFLIQTLFYLYIIIFCWFMINGLLEWGM
nr:uncharacterized protein LOC112210205 [Halyomorpha halys]